MYPAQRKQTDVVVDQEDYSYASGLDCGNLPDMARQEFKEETDVNWILSRFGVGGVIQRQPVYGDRDFDLDLHSGYIAIGESQRAFRQLPKELRDKYGSAKGMLDAMNSGELAKDLAEIPPPPPPDEEAKPAEPVTA